MSGYVIISRALWDDTDFRDGEMTQREAFLWMIAQAAWKDHSVRKGGAVVDLKRGQLAFSTRFLAGKFGWSEARVRRYLDMLKNRRTIDAESDAGVTRITLCNYEKYQSPGSEGDAPCEGKATQQRRTSDAEENTGNTRNTDNKNMLADQFEEAWKAYNATERKANQTKQPAKKAWLQSVKPDQTADIIRAIRIEVDRRKNPDGFIAPLPMMQRWIKEARWQDVLETAGPKPADDNSGAERAGLHADGRQIYRDRKTGRTFIFGPEGKEYLDETPGPGNGGNRGVGGKETDRQSSQDVPSLQRWEAQETRSMPLRDQESGWLGSDELLALRMGNGG